METNMINEKLNELIRKYDIYDAIDEMGKTKSWDAVLHPVRQMFGMVRLAIALNAALERLKDNKVIALWIEGRTRGRIWFWLLSPCNRRKIRFLIQEERSDATYHGRPILASCEVAQHKIDVIVLTAWHSGRHAELIARGFPGLIIDMNVLLFEKQLFHCFSDSRQNHPYVDIFVAAHLRENTADRAAKRLWHQQLIAHYLRARDFLHTKEEIDRYQRDGYEDAGRYMEFWNQVEELLSNIKSRLENRKQRDLLIYWIDQEEKEDFFSMRWTGQLHNGLVFHNAYTTMVNTRAVMYSILTGKNVKAGKLIRQKPLGIKDTIFSDYASQGRELHIYSANMMTKLKNDIRHDCYQNYPTNYAPSMIGMWHALDRLLSTSNACVLLFHCMETHDPYPSAFVAPISHDLGINQTVDCSGEAKKSRDYLDRQLEWYHGLFPSDSISIYMSDHGNEHDLTEQNVNMPFKVMGKGVVCGDEYRLFSYRDMHKLLDGLLRPEGNIDEAFTDAAIVDVIDPYGGDFLSTHLKGAWKHFLYERREISKAELKKYLQTTKVITAEGECYTINILGEETYFRDKECNINLIDNPAYAGRIAELRTKAGKFCNPWKEKRKVAIEFYEYLGVTEKNIVMHCY